MINVKHDGNIMSVEKLVTLVTDRIAGECEIQKDSTLYRITAKLLEYGLKLPYDGTNEVWYDYVGEMDKVFDNAGYPYLHNEGIDFPELLEQLIKRYNDATYYTVVRRRLMTCIFIHWLFLSAGRVLTARISTLCGNMLTAPTQEIRQYTTNVLFGNSVPYVLDTTEYNDIHANVVPRCEKLLDAVCGEYLNSDGSRSLMSQAMHDVFCVRVQPNVYTISLIIMLISCRLNSVPTCGVKATDTIDSYGPEHYASTCVNMYVKEELRLPVLGATLLWISNQSGKELELTKSYLKVCSKLYEYPKKQFQSPMTAAIAHYAIKQQYGNDSYMALLSKSYLDICKTCDDKVMRWLGEIGDDPYDKDVDSLQLFIDNLFDDYGIDAPKRTAFKTVGNTIDYVIHQVPIGTLSPDIVSQILWLLCNFVVSGENKYFPYSKQFIKLCVDVYLGKVEGDFREFMSYAKDIPMGNSVPEKSNSDVDQAWEDYKVKFGITNDQDKELLRVIKASGQGVVLLQALQSLMS